MDTPQGTFYRVYFDIYLTLDGTEFNAELVCQGEVMGRCSARFRWFDFPSLWQRFLALTHFFIVQNTLSRWKRPKSYTTHNQRNAKWDKKDNGQIGGGVRRVWKGRQKAAAGKADKEQNKSGCGFCGCELSFRRYYCWVRTAGDFFGSRSPSPWAFPSLDLFGYIYTTFSFDHLGFRLVRWWTGGTCCFFWDIYTTYVLFICLICFSDLRW